VTLTLRSRLTIVYTAVFGLLLTLIGIVAYRVLQYQLDNDVTANLLQLTTALHGYLHLGPSGVPVVVFDATDPAEAAFVQDATRYYQVFDVATGRLLVQSDAMRPLGLEFTPSEVSAFRNELVMQDVQTDYGRIRLSNSVITPGGGRYLLQVGVSLAPLDTVLQRFLVLLIIGIPASLAAGILAGRSTARIALQPLTDLAVAARRIDVAGLGRRVPVRGTSDELDTVALAFNETLERLEHAVGEMRQFSTALAHELRTPLAALRGEIEMAMREPDVAPAAVRRMAGQLDEIDKLKRLIDQILTLARAEAGEIVLARSRVDLGALATRVVDQIELVAQAKSVALLLDCADAAAVQGDEQWLTRLILNLLDNAIKFTPEGGRIAVAVSHEDGFARLAVQDTGSGIPADAVPHLFDRFFRADPARPPDIEGAGLGLSLVKWIVDQHHGRIDVDSQPGRGSTFSVRLPALD
jgi:heavy metal sensor kinase